jgi:hypothetical protein
MDCRCGYIGFFPVWDFSFFSEKRTKHYLALNRSVFEPLSRLQVREVISDTDFIHNDFVFIIYNIPLESSRIYRLALRHMDFDDPELRTAITSLRTKIQTHNDLRDQVEMEIGLAIRRRLTTTHETP